LPKMNEFKVLLFVMALVLTFSSGLGVHYLYSRYSIEKPLLAQFAEQEAVEEVQIEKIDDIYCINLTLDRVENIQEEYTRIRQAADAKLGSREYELLISGQGNVKLDEVYYEIQPIIYEAMANNRYVWMKDEIKDLAAQEQLDYRMFVDDESVYLQLNDGKYYQYHIIDRDSSCQGAV